MAAKILRRPGNPPSSNAKTFETLIGARRLSRCTPVGGARALRLRGLFSGGEIIMLKPHDSERRRSVLPDIALAPAVARLPTHRERRDVSARTALMRRVRGEFEEMPGMSLTLAQAARLFSLPAEPCVRILRQLVDDGLLHQTADGRYRVRTDAA